MKFFEKLKEHFFKAFEDDMPTIEFVNYTGEWTCLCYGTLTIKVDGKEYEIDHLISGGSVWFDDDWGDHVESGPWSIDEDDIPEEDGIEVETPEAPETDPEEGQIENESGTGDTTG